jgi:hypothetical protein
MPASRPEVQTLVARKGLVRGLAAASKFAGGFLGAAVHRRAVDHRAAGREERIEHAGQALVFVGAGALVEADPGAAADDRQGFLRGGDGAGGHLHRGPALLLLGEGGKRGTRAQGGAQAKQPGARERGKLWLRSCEGVVTNEILRPTGVGPEALSAGSARRP